MYSKNHLFLACPTSGECQTRESICISQSRPWLIRYRLLLWCLACSLWCELKESMGTASEYARIQFNILISHTLSLIWSRVHLEKRPCNSSLSFYRFLLITSAGVQMVILCVQALLFLYDLIIENLRQDFGKNFIIVFEIRLKNKFKKIPNKEITEKKTGRKIVEK